MHELICKEIEIEAKKRLARYSRNSYYVHKYRSSFRKRTGLIPKTSPHQLPDQWSFHKHYDPRYCLNHSAFIAKGIWTSLQAGSYRPVEAIRTDIPKANGGHRQIDAFSVPDAAVAKLFLRNLRSRNAKIFSDSSYAYQENKTPLDAVIRLRSLLSAESVFVIQNDFAKFFDSILHSYLEDSLGKRGPFLTTKMERALLGAVMRHEYVEGGGAPKARARGIPQGNSLSLFLANVAAHPLDLSLGMMNGAFARFADDAVVVNYSYEDALKCSAAFEIYSAASGVELNRDKSSGIRRFASRPTEIATVPFIDFLSYRFTPSGLDLSERAVASIKRRCSRIIYNHLLLYPRRTGIAKKRLGPQYRDWDLVTCVNELRAYIYGGRSQADVEAFLAGTSDIKSVGGAASYFCLIERAEPFQQLDGWLISCMQRAYQARLRLLKKILEDQLSESFTRALAGRQVV